MKSGLSLTLWMVVFLVFSVVYGFRASDQVFSLRTVFTISLLLGWFCGEATLLPQLSEGLKRVAGGAATFLLVAGALGFLLMHTGRLAPPAAFLETGLAILLAFTRINAHFDLFARMREMSRRANGGDAKKSRRP